MVDKHGWILDRPNVDIRKKWNYVQTMTAIYVVVCLGAFGNYVTAWSAFEEAFEKLNNLQVYNHSPKSRLGKA